MFPPPITNGALSKIAKEFANLEILQVSDNLTRFRYLPTAFPTSNENKLMTTKLTVLVYLP